MIHRLEFRPLAVFTFWSEWNKQTDNVFQNVIKLPITLLKMTRFIAYKKQFLNITYGIQWSTNTTWPNF